MRTLTSTLTSAQKQYGEVICKIVLTYSASAWVTATAYTVGLRVRKVADNGRVYICTTAGTSGGTEPTWPTTTGGTVTDGSTLVWTDNGLATLTYSDEQPNVLLKVTRNEQPSSQTAKVLIENYDNTLTVISLEGYQGVISRGFKTSVGAEYSAVAPLKVKAQELLNSNGQLVCQLDLFGIPDQMAKDKALTSYTQESTDTNTIKTLITAIAGGTLTCYSHCPAIPITFEPVSASYPLGYDDGLIDSFCPKDSFRINVGESRMTKIKELLGWTKDVMRVGADGYIHIFNPTVSGTTYDYEYNDDFGATSHPFFSKIYRTRLVLPNRYVVKNSDDSADVETYYEGEYTSSASYAILPKTEPKVLRITSNAQGTAIATAMVQRAELDHEKGSLFAPTNIGAEVWDYVKVTDSVEGDNRVGNTGYLTETYTPGKFDFYFGFGDILLGASIGLRELMEKAGVREQPYVTYAQFDSILGNVYQNLENLRILIEALTTIIEQMQENYTFKKLVITEDLTIPHWS